MDEPIDLQPEVRLLQQQVFILETALVALADIVAKQAPADVARIADRMQALAEEARLRPETLFQPKERENAATQLAGKLMAISAPPR